MLKSKAIEQRKARIYTAEEMKLAEPVLDGTFWHHVENPSMVYVVLGPCWLHKTAYSTPQKDWGAGVMYQRQGEPESIVYVRPLESFRERFVMEQA